MPAICTVPPTVEPITLAEARLHLKETVAGADIDSKINDAIRATRELCENDTRRALLTQTWKVALDAFPVPSMNVSSATWYGPQWGTSPGPLQFLKVDGSTGYEIYLPYPPVQSITSIAYVDTNGNPQTMNVATDIIFDNVSIPCRLLPAYGTTWPGTQTQANAVNITFKCGYGDTADLVPRCAKVWMFTQLGTIYNMPQSEIAAYRETLLNPLYVDRLLDPIRVRMYR